MIPKSWNQISPSLGRSGEERVVTLWSRGRRLYVLLFLGIDTFWGFPSRAQFYKSTVRCLEWGNLIQI